MERTGTTARLGRDTHPVCRGNPPQPACTTPSTAAGYRDLRRTGPSGLTPGSASARRAGRTGAHPLHPSALPAGTRQCARRRFLRPAHHQRARQRGRRCRVPHAPARQAFLPRGPAPSRPPPDRRSRLLLVSQVHGHARHHRCGTVLSGAGASQVIGGLWAIDDELPGELLTRTYDGHLRHGMPLAQAFRAAHRALPRNDRAAAAGLAFMGHP
ncbi:CHAT domain-containing protein [Streptomyces sp. NPDC048594]|uniref:CHAT domain-containing protein n=1 Tax=Streptomyces sp. NPDC048594 TaxID=3365575 RepID=UPI00371412A3